MGYSKEVYRIASAKLAERRAKAEREAEERRTAFFAACPRALEIERELSRTGVAAARAVLAGGNVRENLERLKENNQALQSSRSFFAGPLSRRITCPYAMPAPNAGIPAMWTVSSASACARRCAMRPAANSMR